MINKYELISFDFIADYKTKTKDKITSQQILLSIYQPTFCNGAILEMAVRNTTDTKNKLRFHILKLLANEPEETVNKIFAWEAEVAEAIIAEGTEKFSKTISCCFGTNHDNVPAIKIIARVEGKGVHLFIRQSQESFHALVVNSDRFLSDDGFFKQKYLTRTIEI
jgi:hypothetical protein